MLRRLIDRLNAEIRIRRDPVGYARNIGVEVGDGCRLLALKMGTFGSEPYLVKLGNHVTVTAGVDFVTHDGGVWVFREEDPDIEVFAPIRVGNNVFIGMNAMIMPGVTIGDNCVIGAGSIVTRDIPSGSVAVGAPARVVRSTEEYRQKIKDRAFHIRSLPADEKKAFLVNTFKGE